jgi:hypothetical protein
MLFLFERLGGIERRADADDERMRVSGQPLRKVIGERVDVECVVNDDGGHAGAAIMARHFDAVSRRIQNALALPDRIVDFAGRDVLALPAKSVADAIDEMEEALLVEPHQVAGAEPGVALGEHVAQNFLFGLARVGIALETPTASVRRADAADGFAAFAARAGDAKAVITTKRCAALGVDLDDRGREAMRQQRRDAADRADLALDIVEREIAFGRRVKFEDARDREAGLELLPDVTAQAVAAGEPQPVLGLEFGYRRLQQIAAELPDILEQGTVEADQVASATEAPANSMLQGATTPPTE